MNPPQHQLVRLLLAGLNDIEEWRLGDPVKAAAKGYPRVYPAELIDDWGILFIDVAVEESTGQVICHEVNGPNAVGSDALTGESSLRSEGEARQAVKRAREMGFLSRDGQLNRSVVAVHAHQHWRFFRTGGEFYPRVDLFANYLEAYLPGQAVYRRGAGERLGEEQVSVVMGDVPSVASHLTYDATHKRFYYQDRPVIFAGNPNLLPELVRTGKFAPLRQRTSGPELRIFHAWRLLPLIHDKGRQQLLLRGTSLRPLRHFEAETLEEALPKTRALLAHGPVVLKPNGTSGGTGVQVVVPAMTDQELRDRLHAVLADSIQKYGPGSEATLLPLRGFEFIRSTGYPLTKGGGHLWDLRIAVLFEPGVAKVFPVSLRITPDPFDEQTFHRGRDQWVSNVSGRQTTLLKSGMDDDVLAAVRMTPALLEQTFAACIKWLNKAWDSSIRDGGTGGGNYEDACEQLDEQFYPWKKQSS